MTRLGNFFKVLGKKILSKVAQIFGDVLGYFENDHYFYKTLLWILCGQGLGVNSATFYPTSGHTVSIEQYRTRTSRYTATGIQLSMGS